MDESNATRVSAPPDEVAERSERRPQSLRVSLRLDTTLSANGICGVLLQKLNAVTGVVVDSININRSEKPLARYERQRGRD